MKDNVFINVKDVFINNLYYDKKLYNHTILKAHLDNFSYLKNKNVKFSYFYSVIF